MKKQIWFWLMLAASCIFGSLYWLGPPMNDEIAWIVFSLWIASSLASFVVASTTYRSLH